MTVKYTCNDCGSNNIEQDATVYWSITEQRWLASNLTETYFCHDCHNDTDITETVITEPNLTETE